MSRKPLNSFRRILKRPLCPSINISNRIALRKLRKMLGFPDEKGWTPLE